MKINIMKELYLLCKKLRDYPVNGSKKDLREVQKSEGTKGSGMTIHMFDQLGLVKCHLTTKGICI